MGHVVTGNLDIVDKLGNFDQLRRVIQLGYKYKVQSSFVIWGRINPQTAGVPYTEQRPQNKGK